MDTEESARELTIELAELKELLKILKDGNVHSFQGAGITVVFNEPSVSEEAVVTAAATVQDDGHSTSTKRVDGFGFKDKRLWQEQNGKVLTFTGDFE